MNLQALRQQYQQQFGNDDNLRYYSTPGRTEIIGNHTDHQHGKVLAAAIDLKMVAAVSQRSDSKIYLDSKGFELCIVDTQDVTINNQEFGSTKALVKGISARFQELGYKVGGLNISMASDVLEGSGLSSSAAFEVLIGTILSFEFNDGKIDPVEIAKIAQYSENVYFGKPCGLMDQMACSVGGLISIDFFDKENPKVEKIDINPLDYGYKICLVDTKGSHANLTHEYAAIPQEMKEVASAFQCETLSRVDESEFYRRLPQLRQDCGDRAVLRAHHYFQENKRVSDAIDALKKENIKEFLNIIKASGDSSYRFLQNVYTTSDPFHQPISIALAISEQILQNHGVCRIHGGGFAGTIQAFVENDMVDLYKAFIERIFGKGSVHVLEISAVGGQKIDD